MFCYRDSEEEVNVPAKVYWLMREINVLPHVRVSLFAFFLERRKSPPKKTF